MAALIYASENKGQFPRTYYDVALLGMTTTNQGGRDVSPTDNAFDLRTPDKPVGTVWLATASRGEGAEATLLSASGDRAAVRERSVARALELLLARIEATPPAPR